jgi:hypothetical protein
MGAAAVRWPAVAAAEGAGGGATAATAASRGYSARDLVAEASGELEAGHPGPAILRLERARLLAPRSGTIAAGLDRARAAANLPAARAPFPQRAAHWLSPNEWALLAIAGLVVAAAAIVAISWGRAARRGLSWLLGGGLALAAIGVAAAVEVSPRTNSAIIVAPDVVARVAPFAGAEVAFSAPEGSAVLVERAFGDYVLVAGPEGRGWVPRRSAETVLPHGNGHI